MGFNSTGWTPHRPPPRRPPQDPPTDSPCATPPGVVLELSPTGQGPKDSRWHISVAVEMDRTFFFPEGCMATDFGGEGNGSDPFPIHHSIESTLSCKRDIESASLLLWTVRWE